MSLSADQVMPFEANKLLAEPSRGGFAGGSAFDRVGRGRA